MPRPRSTVSKATTAAKGPAPSAQAVPKKRGRTAVQQQEPPATNRLVTLLEDLLKIPSPSGYTDLVIDHIATLVGQAGIKALRTNKGALLVGNHPAPKLVVAGHIDTLGAMVRSIRGDGHLGFTLIGGPLLPSFEGNYVQVLSRGDVVHTGTLVLENPAAHVNRQAGSTERKPENMLIRLDAEVAARADTEKLGIAIGDFIAFEPRVAVTPSGYVKAHFLDDKAGSAAMLDALLTLGAARLQQLPVAFFFSNYEEVGHGACAGLPPTATEMLVVDMGVVGTDVAGEETAVSICVKDSSGPYDYGVRCRLTDLARSRHIPYRLDVFPFYGSDGSAALHAGHNLRIGLIGPGVGASHGNERTHLKGLTATRDLLCAYIEASSGSRQG